MYPENDPDKRLSGKEQGSNEKEERYWAWICSVPGLYCRQIETLVSYFGSPEEVYLAPEREFLIWKEKGLKWVGKLLAFRRQTDPEMVRHYLEGMGIRFVSRCHDAFPQKLRLLGDCPSGLFYRGQLPEEERKTVAVVGARACSNYGIRMARELSEHLVHSGAQVVSGLALGIDGWAQKTAVELGGSSFAVLGNGLDLCYPPEHQWLFCDLQINGGVISEYPPGTEPLAIHFPMRNRVISGLSDAVIVVEARKKSGSLITADLALEQGKEVFAVPGRSSDELSYGCNHLIMEGAGVILSPESMIRQLKLDLQPPKKEKKTKLVLAQGEKWVYSNLDLSPRSMDELVRVTDLPVDVLGEILLKLELKGLVSEVSRNHYIKMK